MWPSYKAEVNTQGMQQLKDYYDLVKKIGEATFFKDEYSYSKKENIQRLMDKRKELQTEAVRAKQSVTEFEAKIHKNKGDKSPAILESKINELEKTKAFCIAENKKFKEQLTERERDLKEVKDRQTQDLIKQRIQQTKENIMENKKEIKELNIKLLEYKKTYSLVDKSKSEEELMYEIKLRQVQMFERKIKSLNDKARDYLEDAI
jgi:chromosome segregation ATPase